VRTDCHPGTGWGPMANPTHVLGLAVGQTRPAMSEKAATMARNDQATEIRNRNRRRRTPRTSCVRALVVTLPDPQPAVAATSSPRPARANSRTQPHTTRERCPPSPKPSTDRAALFAKLRNNPTHHQGRSPASATVGASQRPGRRSAIDRETGNRGIPAFRKIAQQPYPAVRHPTSIAQPNTCPPSHRLTPAEPRQP
jgi:hypothetical protein